MANPPLRFHFREPTIDTNLALTDGTVAVEGFDFEVVDGPADAMDQGFGALVGLQAAGRGGVSIPAYPNRKFRQSYIQINVAAGIELPKDLEAKRVGIPAWANTAGEWARGALQNYYGVDLGAIRWCSANESPSHPRPNITVEMLPPSPLAPDERFDRMLLEGELDAVIFPDILASISRRDPRVRRLVADSKHEEQTRPTSNTPATRWSSSACRTPWSSCASAAQRAGPVA